MGTHFCLYSPFLFVFYLDGGGVAAFAAVSIAFTLAENCIGGTTLASIDGSSVVSTGAVTVSAFADNTLDMGTGYDCFDPLSHTANPSVSAAARRNRLLLKAMMERHGFVNYDQEWWHFTLADEPFPSTFFDVPVR